MLRFLPFALLAGCSCNQDYSFPKMNDLAAVDPPATFGNWLSMDVAPDGKRVTLTYYDREMGGAAFAIGMPDGDTINWVHERIDGYPGSDGLDKGDMGKYSSHKVAPDGTVWVAYKDAGNGGLWVAHRTAPQVWEPVLVDAGSGMGNWASLDLDASGNPVVAHHDSNEGNLRVCHWGAEAWTCEVAHTGQDSAEPNDTGIPAIVDANVGQYARLMIANGVEHIAFYDAAFGSLNLLEGNPGAYVHTVVDDGGDVGQWPALHLEGDDLYISYHDIGDQDLLLSYRSGGQWSKLTVDDSDYVGADSEIFVQDGKMSILYFDGFNNDVKVAVNDGGSWTSSTLAGDGVAVGFHNEVVQVEGQTWTVSYNYTDNTVNAARVESGN